MKGGLSVDSLTVEMDTGGLKSEAVLGDPRLNIIYTQLNGALKMLQVFTVLGDPRLNIIYTQLNGALKMLQVSSLTKWSNVPLSFLKPHCTFDSRFLDSSTTSLVGKMRRILTRFWNWNHRSLPPRWGDVSSGPNVIKKFKENSRQDSRKCFRN
ncbi:hypothetical protein PoB_007600700 [Plakobranchus ocellatus]|uniref:Uncharacterized protein n=1 Tax=Plakobranchus ocellatus TaxID=259542 RepID=A0AAV4DYS3_9GAST|nr:hypothetical protein PoB_007600700 [Plakobranchus ocellatus]